jgi:hypothetical protein
MRSVILAAKFVATLVNGEVPSTNTLHLCQPPERAFESSIGISDRSMLVAFTEYTNKSRCDTSGIEDDQMWDACKTFCKIGGEQKAIPILMGSTIFGFNHDNMYDMCSAIGDVDIRSQALCKKKSNSLDRIMNHTAEFVVAAELVVSEELALRALMNQQAAALAEKLDITKNAEFRYALQNAPRSNKTHLMREKIKEFREGVSQSETAYTFSQALKNLDSVGKQLNKTLAKHLRSTMEYIEDCNKFFVAYGGHGEYLLDICSQGDAQSCLEDEEAEHVGCCCIINPVLLDVTYLIDGIGGAPFFEGSDRVTPPPPPSEAPSDAPSEAHSKCFDDGYAFGEDEQFGELDSSEEVNCWLFSNANEKLVGFDICAAAWQKGHPYITETFSRIRDMEQNRLVDDYSDRMRKEFESYVDNDCANIFGPGGGRQLESFEESHRTSLSHPRNHSQTQYSLFSLSHRRLQNRLGDCEDFDRPHGLSVVLANTAAPHDTWEPEICSDNVRRKKEVLYDIDPEKGPEDDKSYMTQACKAFCEPNGVPILMGNLEYGFNLDEAEEICMPPKGALRYDEEQMRRCRTLSTGFIEIQEKAAQFLEQVNKFTSAKLLFTAKVRRAKDEFYKQLVSEEFRASVGDQKRSHKAEYFKDELHKKKQELLQGEEKKNLTTQSQLLATRMEDLYATLQESLAKLDAFLDECNDLFLAASAKGEFLLDICARQPAVCIDANVAEHVSCCCAFNPVLFLGEPDYQVMKGRTDGQQRQLGAKEEFMMSSISHITLMTLCPSSWTNAKDYVAKSFWEAAKLGQEYGLIFAGEQEEKSESYGSNYCPFPLPPPPAPGEAETSSPLDSGYVTSSLSDLSSASPDGDDASESEQARSDGSRDACWFILALLSIENMLLE